MAREVNGLAELATLAHEFLAAFPQGAVVGLSGALGAGKTAFVRKCIEHLSPPGVVTKVTSPSFVLHQTYPTLRRPVDHFDLYRLDAADAQSLVELGYYEVLEQRSESKGFVFVEWPEQAVSLALLQLDVQIQIAALDDENRRSLVFSGAKAPHFTEER